MSVNIDKKTSSIALIPHCWLSDGGDSYIIHYTDMFHFTSCIPNQNANNTEIVGVSVTPSLWPSVHSVHSIYVDAIKALF